MVLHSGMGSGQVIREAPLHSLAWGHVELGKRGPTSCEPNGKPLVNSLFRSGREPLNARTITNCVTFSLLLLVASVYPATKAADEGAKPKPRTKTKVKATAKGQPDLLEIPKVSRCQVICFALYTVHNNVLKLTAQLYPLENQRSPHRASGDPAGRPSGQQVATTQIVNPG